MSMSTYIYLNGVDVSNEQESIYDLIRSAHGVVIYLKANAARLNNAFGYKAISLDEEDSISFTFSNKLKGGITSIKEDALYFFKGDSMDTIDGCEFVHELLSFCVALHLAGCIFTSEDTVVFEWSW